MKQRLIKQQNIKSATIMVGAIAVLVCGMGEKTYAANDSATINITGTVKADTCTISMESKNQDIALPNISDKDIKSKGMTAGTKNIDILLTECGKDVKNVVVTVSGDSDKDDNKAFANKATSGASGVGLYFYKMNSMDNFSPDGSVSETTPLTPSEDNKLSYKAKYVATTDDVKAGKFSTIVKMKFDYK